MSTRIITAASASVLIIAYTALLIHVRLGLNSKWLTCVTLLLLFSQVALLVKITATIMILDKGKFSPALFIMNGACNGLFHLLFNLAHFLIAEKYSRVAELANNPTTGVKTTQKRTTCQKVIYWVLFAMNILSGALYGYTATAYYNKLLFKGVEVKPWLSVTKIASLNWCDLCAIISGVILMVGVYRIRKFFVEKEATRVLNVSMLTRHALAFGLYLLSSSAYSVMVTLT